MNDMKKIIGFELKKMKHNKLMLLILAVLFAAVIIIPSIHYWGVVPLEPPVFEGNRAETLQEYQKNLEQYEVALEQYGAVMDKKEREAYHDACKRLRFYIESGTVEWDYLNSEKLTEKFTNRDRSSFMFYFAIFSSFFLWALAIAATAYLFIFEYHTHTLKNVLASRVKRNKLFSAKLLMLLGFLTAVFFALTLFALTFGLTQSNSLLVLFNENYQAISAVTAFVAQSAATYVIMLVLMAVAIFVGILLKNIAVGLASPGVIYGAALLIYFAISDLVATNPAYSRINYLDKIPILSLQFHIGSFDYAFILSLALHFVFAGLLIFLASRRFKRQDL